MRLSVIILLLACSMNYTVIASDQDGHSMTEGVFLEFQFVAGTSIQRDVLRVSVLESRVLVQGAFSLSQSIPVERGRALIYEGTRLCPSNRSVVIKDAVLSVALDVRHKGTEKSLRLLQNDIKGLSEVDGIFAYLKEIEFVIGLSEQQLITAAKSIVARAQSYTGG